MQYTDFVREAGKKDSSITWKDILEESFARHTKQDMEKAMRVGEPVPAQLAWERWHRPWLWWTFAKYGLGLVFMLYGIFYICNFFLGGVAQSLVHMAIIIPPIVIPFVILVLLWELNVPQNISFAELLGYFMAGGIGSFVITTLLFQPFPSQLPAYYAALREEPAKFGAALLILVYIERVQKKQIYGLTGLVVGAAVGAAFSAIESVSYAINFSADMRQMIDVQLERSLLALGGHITYCVPYATAMALKKHRGSLTAKSVFNPMTIGALLFSTALHAIWNGSGSSLIHMIIVVGGVFILLYWVKASLYEAACAFKTPTPGPDADRRSGITLCVKSTPIAGTHCQSNGEPIVVGRQRGVCRICFPEGTRGVSRQHCRVVWTGDGWYVQDLESTYGTYAGGRKLAAFEMYPLASGENIYLGSKQVWITVL